MRRCVCQGGLSAPPPSWRTGHRRRQVHATCAGFGPTSSDSSDSCAVPWSASKVGGLRRRLDADHWQAQTSENVCAEPDTPVSRRSVASHSSTEVCAPELGETPTSLARGPSQVSLCSASASAGLERVVYQAKPLFAHPRSAFSLAVDTITLAWAFLGHGVITAWPYLSLVLLAGALYLHALRYAAIVAFSTLLLPRCPFTWSAVAVLDRVLFMHWRRHSSYWLTYDSAISSDQQYIVAEFPHGVYPLAGQLHASVWPHLHMSRLYLLAADVLFWVPLWRHYMSVGGAASATIETMHRLLQQGHSIAVHVGGIAEMFETYPDREVIYLSRRRGFLRVAAEHGVPVVPMYHFGNTQILSFVPRVLQPLSRKLRVSLGIFCGQFGLPIPEARPLWTVAGRPIDMGSGMSPGDPAFAGFVEQKHEEFSNVMQQLFHSHKHEYHDGVQSWAERGLEIK